MQRFTDRVVLVTGSARGIGAATARRFAQEGASVAIVDLDESAAAATAEGLGDANAIGIGCDVSDSVSVSAAVERTVAELGGLHVLVNNAGVTRDNLLFKMSDLDWDMVMNVHLRGAFLCSRAAQQVFVPQRYGKIVSLSSVSALGNRGQANYSAAKMGIQGLTRTLAIELGPFGVNVNAVAPGFIVTDMTDETARRVGMEPQAFRDAAAAETPVRRVGLPEDIATAIAFLASDEASFVTGQTLYVDGGRKL
jgi:3-oxoacyl-[acyl-carrier protein] reductase